MSALHVILAIFADACLLLLIAVGCMGLIGLAAAGLTVGLGSIHGRRARRKNEPAREPEPEQPLWDRTRLTADEYSVLAQIEAEEKAAEQERRDRARGAGAE